MKMKLPLSTVVLLAVASGSARAQDHAFDDVPLDNWAYSALEKLQEISSIGGVKKPPARRPMVRYEFAFAICLWEEKHEKHSDTPEQLKAQDIVEAFNHEFAPEIAQCHRRLESDTVPSSRPHPAVR